MRWVPSAGERIYWDLENKTDLPDGVFESTIEEALAKVKMPGADINFGIKEAFSPDEAESTINPHVAEKHRMEGRELLSRYGGFGTFIGWAYVHNEPSFAVHIVWIPSGAVGIHADHHRSVSDHGGLIYDSESLADAVRFVVAHEVWHCRTAFRLGVNHGYGQHEEMEADAFAIDLINGTL
jgi:hypothetical protein